MPSELQSVARDLVACLDMMPRVIDALQTRARRCREVAGFVGGLSSGSRALQAAAYQLDAAANECDKAAHFCEIAYRQARDWAAQMVGDAGGGSTPEGSRNASRPTGGPGAGDAKPTAPAKPGSTVPRPPDDGGDPDAQAVIRRLPVRENDEGKTRGLWTDGDGQERPLVSGNGHYQKLADDHARRLGLPPMSSTSHVEMKFAMFMRERDYGMRPSSSTTGRVRVSGAARSGLSCSFHRERNSRSIGPTEVRGRSTEGGSNELHR